MADIVERSILSLMMIYPEFDDQNQPLSMSKSKKKSFSPE